MGDELDPPRLMVYEPRADGEWRHGFFLGAFRMEPTPADLLAALRALPRAERVALLRDALQGAPDEAVEVVDGLKVARAWSPYGVSGARENLWGREPIRNGIGGEPDLKSVQLDEVDEVWFDPDLPTGCAPTFDTRDEAMAAADAALVAQGWALAGEVDRG